MTDYVSPGTVDEVIALLARYEGQARILAGGTDVLPDLRRQKFAPQCLVDVTRVSGLDQIRVTERFVEVGAAVTFARIKDHPLLQTHVPALTDAARSVGALAIQNAATWVGNVVQAMPAADGAIVAIALEAEARVLDAHGATWQPVEALFLGPGVSAIDPSRQFVTHLRFPCPPALAAAEVGEERPAGAARWGTAWGRVGRRPSLVLPILNCAVKLCFAGDDDQITRATIALGPVAPRPFRAREAEAFLQGQPPTAAVFEHAARLVQGVCNPRSSIMRASREYRLTIIPRLVSDTLRGAAERAKQN
jgi:CO/xanthine dehydrogenase FAD-binding subunit